MSCKTVITLFLTSCESEQVYAANMREDIQLLEEYPYLLKKIIKEVVLK